MKEYITVVGSKVTALVFSKSKVIILLLAVSGRGLSRCSSCIACKPKGVAALPKPRRLAQKFNTMPEKAGLSAGSSGKSRCSRGAKKRPSLASSPLCSSNAKTPNHSINTPASDMIKLTLLLAPAKAACVTKPILPCQAAAAKPANSNKNQIKLTKNGAPPMPYYLGI